MAKAKKKKPVLHLKAGDMTLCGRPVSPKITATLEGETGAVKACAPCLQTQLEVYNLMVDRNQDMSRRLNGIMNLSDPGIDIDFPEEVSA